MPRRLQVSEVVNVRCNGRAIDAVEVADEAHQIGPCGTELVARDVHLGAVAGREHGGLAGRSARRQRLERDLDAARLKIETFPQLDGSRPVADAD